jgi:hypothetical protein
MRNPPCCRQGHADLTRTVSGASDAAGRHKRIEPIDRIPSRESKEQCEKLQVASLVRTCAPLLLLIIYLKSQREKRTDVYTGSAGSLRLPLSLLAPIFFGAVRPVTWRRDGKTAATPRDNGKIWDFG